MSRDTLHQDLLPRQLREARPDSSSPGRIIGGVFALADLVPAHKADPPFLQAPNVLFHNARSGIVFLIDLLQPSTLWMPSYLCGSMMEAAASRRVAIEFYEVDEALSVVEGAWIDAVRPGDLFVLIDYFGFPCDASWIREVQQRGAWVLEDASQALLSEHAGQGGADFCLYSPRKLLGVPDGGILAFRDRSMWQEVALPPPPTAWWLQALAARVQRRDFDQCGQQSDREWFRLYQETEQDAPVEPHAMSDLSRMMLDRCFDYAAIAEQRIANYQRLLHTLAEWTLFPVLPAGVVPLGFPLRVPQRDRVRQALFEAHIYPPVHWSLAGIVPARFEASHQLSAHMMTLPCDQRYGAQEMERMAQKVREAIQ